MCVYLTVTEALVVVVGPCGLSGSSLCAWLASVSSWFTSILPVVTRNIAGLMRGSHMQPVPVSFHCVARVICSGAHAGYCCVVQAVSTQKCRPLAVVANSYIFSWVARVRESGCPLMYQKQASSMGAFIGSHSRMMVVFRGHLSPRSEVGERFLFKSVCTKWSFNYSIILSGRGCQVLWLEPVVTIVISHSRCLSYLVEWAMVLAV